MPNLVCPQINYYGVKHEAQLSSCLHLSASQVLRPRDNTLVEDLIVKEKEKKAQS
jgi:hypothetical protein